MAKHYDLGKEGEKIAVDFLQKLGYQILEKNWHFRKAEVDIIAKKDDVLICVEVKTRTTDKFGTPQEFISPKKIQLLTQAIDEYVRQKDLDVEVRFDVIAIVKKMTKTSIKHLKNAFFHF